MRRGLRSISTALRAVLWGGVGSLALAVSAMAQPTELLLDQVGGGNFVDRLTGTFFTVRPVTVGFLSNRGCPQDQLIIAAIEQPVVAGPDPAPPMIEPAALAAIARVLATQGVAYERGGNYAMTDGPYIWCGDPPPVIPDQSVARGAIGLGAVAPADLNFPVAVARADADALGVVAALMGGGSNRPMCTGSLVGDRTILTAAHCVCDGQLKSVIFTNDTRWVVPGDPSVTRGVLVSYRLYDKGFCEANDQDRRTKIDLALVYTEAPLGIDPSRYLRVSDDRADLNGDAETIVGFGMSNQVTEGGQKRQADLTEAQGPVRRCTTADAAVTGCNPGLELFVVNDQDFYRDTCPGDSGGPLLAWRADGTGVIVGITLGGLNGSHRACGEGGIYLDLTPPGPGADPLDLALWIQSCTYDRLLQRPCP